MTPGTFAKLAAGWCWRREREEEWRLFGLYAGHVARPVEKVERALRRRFGRSHVPGYLDWQS